MRSGPDETLEQERSKKKKSGKASNEIEFRKIAPQDLRCRRFHPFREDSRIDGSEIDVVEKVPGIEPVEERLFAI